MLKKVYEVQCLHGAHACRLCQCAGHRHGPVRQGPQLQAVAATQRHNGDAATEKVRQSGCGSSAASEAAVGCATLS